MLDIFAQAPEVTAFDLGCLSHDTDRMSFRRTWTLPQVRKAFGWLAARNASGSSCYIRPARAIARTRWVLVDGLTAATLKRLSASHPPNMVVQTAVERFQAWLRLTEPVDCATRVDVARVVTRESGGDPDAVDGAQFGNLPGTTNRVPSSVREGRAVPHPVSWTQVWATRLGVARTPRGPRVACDRRASRGASTGCSARRTRRRRRARRRDFERPGRRRPAP